jgi:hypoxanthine phosphoribosyltransferase
MNINRGLTPLAVVLMLSGSSGNTLSKVREILSLRQPKSLAICTLLDKPTRREVDVPVEYVGFSIPDEFVVGYGIDYAQRYRHLPYVGKVVLLDE